MAVLVTGVGYIGAALVHDLLRRGEQVVAVDNFFSTDREAVDRLRGSERLAFVRGSVNSRATLAKAFAGGPRITTVYSLAAQSSAHPEAAPARYTELTNLLSPRLLLEAMREFGATKIVYGSSFWVYGQNPPAAIDERTPYGSFSDLAHLSKCYVEKLLEMYAANLGLRCVAARLGIVYGLSPVMKRDYRFMTVPNKFCLQAARREEIVVGEGASRPMGFIHVEDACRALALLAEAGGSGEYVPVNVVSEMATVHEVARVVAREARVRGIPLRSRVLADERTESLVVKSRLDGLDFAAGHKMESSLGPILDFFAQTEAGGQ